MFKLFGRHLVILLLLVTVATQFLPTPALAAPKPKNVIILMVDGSGATHSTVSRWYKGEPLAMEEIVVGSVRTYSAESLITDSAPASTAFATGNKSNSKFIGVLPVRAGMPDVAFAEELKYQPVASVLEGAKLAGKSTGLIATSNIQHASPAGYSSHNHNRGDYNDIAEQQVNLNIDVVFGGGKQYLLPKSQGGVRTDGENLIDVLKSRGYGFVETREQLLAAKNKKVWGMFAEDAMAYDFDRVQLQPQEPSLAEMTQKAIDILAKNDKGFFLFVEGSKVDWASHANDPVGVISDVLAFDDAVKTALDFAKKDGNTLVLAFSDHGNGGMSLGNKSTDKNYDTLPYSALVSPLRKAMLTGEGIEKMLAGNRSEANIREIMEKYFGIADLTTDEITTMQKAKKGEMNYAVGPMISKRSVIGWTTNGHTGEDLFMYGFGPGAPKGTIENTDIAKISAKGLGVELASTTKRLFVEADKAFAAIGAKTEIDLSNKENPRLVVTKGNVRAELPFSTNTIIIDQKTKQMEGLTIFAAKLGKVYVPMQAVELVKAAL
ncbi:MAG: alkaline phosphatase [Anaerosporomusa subterranea]|nr:alkaline phosphatase [Anaerosporomusa subterranea]